MHAIVLFAAVRLMAVATPDLGDTCDDLDLSTFADALEAQAVVYDGLDGSLPIAFGRSTFTYRQYADRTLRPLARLAREGREKFCARLAKDFVFYKNPGPDGKFTAYDHPTFKGSRERKKGLYEYPLYRKPDDPRLVQLTTKRILDGALKGKGLELAWLSHPQEVNAIHVEGSATIELDGGERLLITYAASNSHPYRRVLKQAGDTARQFIGRWVRNPRFIFFKETEFEGVGEWGPLVPGRSIAVDPQWIPLGSAVWLTTVGLRRAGIAQDKGVAIVGPGRVDLFFGSGAEARQAAEKMTQQGSVYVLLAR